MVMKRPMVAFLTQLLFAFRSPLTRRARLEAENLILRQQLVVLRRKSPTRVRLWNIDRLLLVWLYRLYPSLLDAIIIVQPETVIRFAPTRFPRLLAVEVPPRRRPSKDRLRDASADPADEPREPTVGRTADPRRIVDAWNRGR
jgi:hypothetical protein